MRDQNEDIQLNGNATIQVDDKGIPSSLSSHWDPTLLIRKLYEVTYEPRMETKRCRFINMEGHIEVPNEEFEEGFERKWVPKYVKTRDGRLQFFVTHYADETPAEEKLLSGAEVEVLRDERILRILGGRAHLKISLRVPSALIDKWRQALLSHAASSSIDAYIRPIPSAIPHNNQRVLIIELGCCSMRGGILTSEPSLPSSFFPSIAAILPNGNIIVGEEAYLPQNRLGGRLAAPLTVSDSLETYSINKDVLRASILKIVNDSKLDPKDYKALVSLSQNIPSVLIEDIMKILLEDIHFQAAAVTRQPSLVLYAYDVSTGVVVDIGDKLSIIPVVDGYMVESGIVSLPHGGKQMQNCMRRQLAQSNQGVYGHDNIIDSLLLRNVMEETSFVSQDAQEESVNCKSVTISLSPYNPISTMPSSLTIDKSRFMAIEGLFTPNKWNIEGKGLHQLIHESIQNSPIDARRVLYRNIYLAGGASLIPGLAERLESELANIVPSTIHSQVHISPWRSNAAFLGAQVVAKGVMSLLSNTFIDESQPRNLTDTSECEQMRTSIFKCIFIFNESFSQEYYVHKVFPPVIEQEPRLVSLAIVFILCFIVSLAGNVSILTMIYGIIKNNRACASRNGEHTIIYICALCITDLFISISLPTAIADNLLGFWLFGTVICKIHHICGSVGRILSTFLITAISFDRYAAVCHPLSSRFRSHSFVYTLILGMIMCAIILLLPLLLYSDTREYIIHEVAAYDSLNVTRVRVYKCTDAMPKHIFLSFTYSTFTIGFIVPLSLIIYFDYNLLKQLHIHIRQHPNSDIPLHRIFRYTIVISIIYFIGWTPYWWSVLYGSFLLQDNSLSEIDGRSVIDMAYPNYKKDALFTIYVLHAFPYLAIATNWIFYGLLNTQLQTRAYASSVERSTFINTSRSREGQGKAAKNANLHCNANGKEGKKFNLGKNKLERKFRKTYCGNGYTVVPKEDTGDIGKRCDGCDRHHKRADFPRINAECFKCHEIGHLASKCKTGIDPDEKDIEKPTVFVDDSKWMNQRVKADVEWENETKVRKQGLKKASQQPRGRVCKVRNERERSPHSSRSLARCLHFR
ncbi:hypothetical protein PRIPAC_79471, partial [Pristionchus pacificus]|uniref:G protein-coupled receptor n=1 Tax=Pristionchus pacificus TaxID=54126 RepID=A0A2A6BYV3_PRIPA